jgi:hypothetical protein
MSSDEFNIDLTEYEVMRDNGMLPVDLLAIAWRNGFGPGQCVRLVRTVFGCSLRDGLDYLGDAHQKYADLPPHAGEFYS